MEEFYIRDSGEFNDWLLFERTRYQKLSLQVLEQLYEAYTAAGDLAGAESSCRRCSGSVPMRRTIICA